MGNPRRGHPAGRKPADQVAKITGGDDKIVPRQQRTWGRRTDSPLTSRLAPDAAQTGDLTYRPPTTYEAILTDLRYEPDDVLHVRVDEYRHLHHLAVESEYDPSTSDYLTGLGTWADAAQQVLAERKRRGYRFDPGRMRVDRLTLDLIRARVDLAALIGERVVLRPLGRSWQGRCPYHRDTRPSFHVYPDQRYYCYSCLNCGDIFTWLQAVEGIDFMASVRRAADMAGIELPTSQRSRRRTRVLTPKGGRDAR